MKVFKYLLYGIVALFAVIASASTTKAVEVEEGVSLELAEFRKDSYTEVSYRLSFRLPEQKTDSVAGQVAISLVLKEPQPLILDFRASANQVQEVKLNGGEVPFELRNEHILIDKKYAVKGKNCISVLFKPDDQSLNRRDEFLYTLLVPDRARTLFPCFDQPDMKALYQLSLDVPHGWTALSNSAVAESDTLSNGRIHYQFKQTEPLSTYLFSFVAGRFDREIYQRSGREISILLRETDKKKRSQTSEIAEEVFNAMEWMENFTGIAYPFAKYDLVILPGFQYGGMEHTGATLYNDDRMFLNEHPTLNERLRRSLLIAHETAHMWFGDFVTMKWFNDVWTKEVFANYFAARIVEPQYPEVDHRLNFIQSYLPAAYSEDRTDGATPIQQPLDNLRNAGLVYGNIIYNKSPVVMEMLVQILGEEAFRQGIRAYLKKYAYGNATWDDLVKILNGFTDHDLITWSQVWVHESGMPHLRAELKNNRLCLTQTDPRGRGLRWPQRIACQVGNEIIFVNLTEESDTVYANLSLPIETNAVAIPNVDGHAYGFFRLTADEAEALMATMYTSSNNVLKGSLLQTLYENVQQRTVNAEKMAQNMLKYAEKESNPLLFSSALGYIGNIYSQFEPEIAPLEKGLWKLVVAQTDPSRCLQAFRLYQSIAKTPEALDRLYDLWLNEATPKECPLSESDYISLSYKLSIQLPNRANFITNRQLQRIQNPDRRRQYAFIAPSVSPVKAVRDSVFQSLLEAPNRRVEPWASTALSYLNSRYRDEASTPYIRPALEALEEVQRTGDIFFPTSWIRSLVSGHHSEKARSEVQRFLNEHPDYPIMLENKILQHTWYMSGSEKKQ